jgi:hypothetical protein
MLFLPRDKSNSLQCLITIICVIERERVIVLDLPMDHKIPLCQVCGAELRRVYTAVPAIFKGTGWASNNDGLPSFIVAYDQKEIQFWVKATNAHAD